MTDHNDTGNRPQRHQGKTAVLVSIALLAAVVVIAPVALSAQDLYHWAASKTGLGLTGIWPVVVFVALDAAAALCIAIVFYAAWRGEAGGVAHLLVWVFAGMSAFANWRRGEQLLIEGTKDAVWFFPAMSIAGAVLLEVVFRKVRHWARANAGVFEPPLPRFRMTRWMVARDETWRAWKAAVVEGYSRPRDAIAFVRGETVVAEPTMPATTVAAPDTVSTVLTSGTQKDALRYAFGILGSFDVQPAVKWLAERGVKIDQSNAYRYQKSIKSEQRPLHAVGDV